MLLGKCQVKKVWKQSYKDKLVIACFTGIVLGTTTRSIGDLQQLPHWRFQLAISIQHCLCWTETNPPQHNGKGYNTDKVIIFFSCCWFCFQWDLRKSKSVRILVLLSPLKRAQWPKLGRGHDSSTRLNTSEGVKWGTMQKDGREHLTVQGSETGLKGT